MPSYSTKTLAKLLCVSSQTVRNAAKKLGIKAEQDKGTRSFVFSSDEAELIADCLGLALPTEEEFAKEDSQVVAYKEEIEFLRKQLEERDKLLLEQSQQITALIDTNKALAASNAVQVAAEKKPLLVEPSEEPSPGKPAKKGFWARLFGA